MSDINRKKINIFIYRDGLPDEKNSCPFWILLSKVNNNPFL